MADVIKVLAQSAPASATETTLYTCGASNGAAVSSLMVCNTGGSADSFRIAVIPGGGSTAAANYLYYDVAIPSYETFAATIGITLADTDVIKIYATNGTCSFSLFGLENQ